MNINDRLNVTITKIDGTELSQEALDTLKYALEAVEYELHADGVITEDNS